jgi:hypothetical protein
MSGFLQRLATQAMGIAPGVRTTASSPFAAMPSLVEESLPVAASSPGDLPTNSMADGGSSRTDGGGAPLTVTPSPGQTNVHGDVDTDRSEGRAGRTNPAPAPEMGGSATGGAPEPGPSPLLPAQPENGASPQPGADRGAPVGVATVEGDALAEAAYSLPGRAEPAVFGPTELLLPPPARPSVAANWFERERPGVERRPGGNRPGPVEETTEVHVSIGRIEVTAVHEAAPPKRAAPRRPAPMSLDEYVATRQGRRP